MTTDLTEMEWLEARADNAVYWLEQLEEALSQARLWRAKIESEDYVVIKLAGVRRE